ncbi:MAG: TonB-dependent receptor [Bacteroidota bacterium]
MKAMKWKATALIVASVLFGTIHVLGQTGAIHGKILSEKNGEPVPFASVQLDGTSNTDGTTADENGRFKLAGLNPGYYNIRVQSLGFDAYELKAIQVSTDKITFLGDIELAAAEYIIGNGDSMVVITAKATVHKWEPDLISVDDPTIMHMLPMDIEKSPYQKNVQDLLTAMSSSFRRDQSTGAVLVRGSRPNDVVYFIDGVKSTDAGFSVPSLAIGNLRAYTSGVPARYGDVTGGVVIVETKSYFDLLKMHQIRQLQAASAASQGALPR